MFHSELAHAAIEENDGREFCQPTTQAYQVWPNTPELGFGEDRYSSAVKGKGVDMGDLESEVENN